MVPGFFCFMTGCLLSGALWFPAKEIVGLLHEAGIRHVVMLTGDSRNTAAAIAETLGIDDYRAEVLPEDKAAFIRSMQEKGQSIIMIGDGINDAPALSLADAGIAVGSGASVAREVADITIAAKDLREILLLRRLSEKLMKRVSTGIIVLSWASTAV